MRPTEGSGGVGERALAARRVYVSGESEAGESITRVCQREGYAMLQEPPADEFIYVLTSTSGESVRMLRAMLQSRQHVLVVGVGAFVGPATSDEESLLSRLRRVCRLLEGEVPAQQIILQRISHHIKPYYITANIQHNTLHHVISHYIASHHRWCVARAFRMKKN
jgi:hypothetical protein